MGSFKAHHLAVSPAEVAGNGGRGRFFLLPGSLGRARAIAERLDDRRVHTSERGLDVFVGTLESGGPPLDLGIVPTGMGCPSLDIVVTELIQLGARRFLRVGTSGSLQPKVVTAGSLVIATAAVRDEATSGAYAPREYPAVAHPDWIAALSTATATLGLSALTYSGVVHTKDSLFDREFGYGPRAEENHRYKRLLADLGALASEMETSHLFVLAAVHGTPPRPLCAAPDSTDIIKTGALLAVIGDDQPFTEPETIREAEERAIEVALEAALELDRHERRRESG